MSFSYSIGFQTRADSDKPRKNQDQPGFPGMPARCIACLACKLTQGKHASVRHALTWQTCAHSLRRPSSPLLRVAADSLSPHLETRGGISLATIWRIEAPLEAEYSAIHNSPRWPTGGGMQKVEQWRPATPMDQQRPALVWQGRLPYRMVFEVRATRIEKQVAMEGASRATSKDRPLAFPQRGRGQRRPYEWHVAVSRWWMNLIARLPARCLSATTGYSCSRERKASHVSLTHRW